MKTRTWAVVLSLSIGAAACGGAPDTSPAADTATAVPVAVDRVAITASAGSFDTGGTLVARQTAIVASRVMAPITRVTVVPGDRVRRGQVLVVLEGDEMTAQAARARAGLESARAGARVAASDRAAAAAGVTLARATYERIATLHAERSATSQELDEAGAALKQAEARAAMAAAQADMTDRGIEAAEAGTRAADIAQSWNTLAAPFDGVVSARHADPGTMAAPGQPLLTLEGTGALQMDVRVDASRAAALAVGQPAEVRIDASGTDEWTAGRIAEIARVDPASHSFVVTVDVAANTNWRSGLFGRARFSGPSAERLTVSADAVVTRGQLTFVYVVGADDHARLRMVSLGEAGGDRVDVLAGLSDGDRVVLRPAPALADGAKVRAGAPAPEGAR
ncbi:MAG: efflux RND transporter periplasmic adaptor subunit [Acidobacteria bacterium]|nr:efflux RND transporter periplasmic adaptor subunit [Acidobacteriota bacterium]